MKYGLQKAQEYQKNDILALYHSMIGGPADWDELYPSMYNIEQDIARENLFVMMDGDNIIGVIAVDEDEEVEQLKNWSRELTPSCELSRICVCQERQNQGCARIIMEYAFEQLRGRGYRGVHILVREEHKVMLQLCSHLDFQRAGSCELYGRSFGCYERGL